MQTTTLPIQTNQLSQLGQANAAQRGAAGDAGQFGAMLSNEMEQRQAAMAPPAPQASAPKAQAPRTQSADKPAQPADKAHDATAADATATDAAPADAAAGQQAAAAGAAGKSASGSDAEGTDAAQDQDAAAAADPAAAMLALMASLHPQAAAVQEAPTKPVAAAFDALTGARGKRGDAGQLAALQAALKSVAPKDTPADAGVAKTFATAARPAGLGPAIDDKTPRVAVEAPVAAGANGSGAEPADLHAALARIKGEATAQAGGDPLPQAVRDAAPAMPSAAQLAATQAQPAVMETAQANGAGTALAARVGSADWDNQVGQKVVWMVGSEEQTASLTLNPPDLGPMQVVLSVTGDQASVTFSSNQQEVRQALENALPRLREMLGESGIALGNATVNTGMPDGRQAQQDGSARGNGGGWGRGERDDGSVAAAETTVRPARARAIGGNGMVDTFA